MKKLYNLSILVAAVLFITSRVSGQDYDFITITTDEFYLPIAVMEAEHYSEMIQIGEIGSGSESYWDTASSPADFSGEGGMKAVNPGPNPGAIATALTSAGYLRFNINFAEAGTYYIWARASHVDPGGGDDSFHAALANGDNIISQCAFINFEGTEAKDAWVWMYYSNDTKAAATVSVPTPGVFNFRVYIRERNFRIDKILLTKDMSYQPDTMSMGPDETIFTGLESLTTGKAGFQVYPNPVISDATISYVLNKTEQISLKVYNVLGEEVTSLSDEIQKAGKHEFKWNACDLSGKRLKGGLYFVRIKAGSETRTVKTILSR
jgi:hypothetical protein